MNEPRWGFEEADDWDDVQPQASGGNGGPPDEPVDALTGQDPDEIISVTVTPQAAVIAVRIDQNWQRAVDPRGLPASVTAAVNSATMLALARQVDESESAQQEAALRGTESASSTVPVDESLSRFDVQRLLDAVSVELDQYVADASTVVDRTVSAESAGRHVSGTARQGQVLHIDIDSRWSSSVRHTEIEVEVLEVLQTLHRRSTPSDELVDGPKGAAISELTALASNPQALLRKLGFPS